MKGVQSRPSAAQYSLRVIASHGHIFFLYQPPNPSNEPPAMLNLLKDGKATSASTTLSRLIERRSHISKVIFKGNLQEKRVCWFFSYFLHEGREGGVFSTPSQSNVSVWVLQKPKMELEVQKIY